MNDEHHSDAALTALVSDALGQEAVSLLINVRESQIKIWYGIEGKVAEQHHYAPYEIKAVVAVLQSRMPAANHLSDSAVLAVNTRSDVKVRLRVARMPCHPEGYDLSVKLLRMSSTEATHPLSSALSSTGE
ncbi:hypothetical protein [Pseudomonas putida]|uniref:Uncharacterized protein n=1 Tax=Pseudomonas putida TaxID=303 RepID=A0A8I1EC19_PSEPU|nr:hypothetical protein [Pseudomonas putida]MBI6882528.1 hypothetical protein [Pseudomonas putida]